MRPIRVGDRVRLVELPNDHTGMTLGKIYIVTHVVGDKIHFFRDDGRATWIFAHRFKLATNEVDE